MPATPGNSALSSPDQQKLVDSHFQEEAHYWRTIYQGTGIEEVVHQERLEVILDFVDKFAPRCHCCVLDIGCGAGLATVALARRGHIVHAVDSVPEMLELTRDAVAQARQEPAVRCARGDIHFLPFNNDTFDVIVAAGVLPWLESSEPALREMCRVLQPGGRLICSTANRWGLCWFLDPLTNPLLKPLKEQVRNVMARFRTAQHRVRAQMISVGECRRLLEVNGLRPLADKALGFGPFTLLRQEMLPHTAGLRLHWLLQTLADRGYPVLRSAGAQYVVAAEKRVTDQPRNR